MMMKILNKKRKVSTSQDSPHSKAGSSDGNDASDSDLTEYQTSRRRDAGTAQQPETGTLPADQKKKRKTDLKNESYVLKRIEEFPDNSLQAKDGHLYCNCCHSFLSKKKSSTNQHVKSEKHLKNLENLSLVDGQQNTIVESVAKGKGSNCRPGLT